MTRLLALRGIGVIGAAPFLAAIYLTFSVPGWLESWAFDYIEAEAMERVDTTIDAVQAPTGDSALSRFARSVYDKNEASIEKLREDLRNRVHEQWAAAIAAIRDLDCECRREWQEWFESGFHSNIALLETANQQISNFVQGTYMEVLTDLKRDVRIFAGSNALAFLLLLLVSFRKPDAAPHLLLPGILLVLATAVCSYFYLFQQNWLLTIIQGSYVGFAYAGWLVAVYAFLLDIALNSARMTTEVINAMLESIGSSASLFPCP